MAIKATHPSPSSVEPKNDSPSSPSHPRHEEYQYLDLIQRIISTGQARPDRTGTGTLALFAPPSLRFSLANGTLPLLTTKRVFTRGVLEELLWFVHGSTDAKILQDKDIHIWDGNGSREYLDKVGLGHRREGDLGPVYGFQWRHFGAEYGSCEDDYTGKGVDQLAQVIDKIKNNPTDRRIIMSAWNPKGVFPLFSFSSLLFPFLFSFDSGLGWSKKYRNQPSGTITRFTFPHNLLIAFPTRPTPPSPTDLPSMALPPCHMFCQFYVTLPEPTASDSTTTTTTSAKPKLSCLMYQRSCDLGLGVPFNIASYSLLTHMIAYITGTEAHEFILQMGDAHIYKDHVEPLKIQLEREPREFPKLVFKRSPEEVGDIDGFKSEDFEVVGYKPMGKIEMKMSA